jgi:hypothetical protein
MPAHFLIARLPLLPPSARRLDDIAPRVKLQRLELSRTLARNRRILAIDGIAGAAAT